jgi:CheY-like chemotaxis protein
MESSQGPEGDPKGRASEPTVLFVHDGRGHLTALEDSLRLQRVSFNRVRNCQQALEALEGGPVPLVVFTDTKLPDGTFEDILGLAAKARAGRQRPGGLGSRQHPLVRGGHGTGSLQLPHAQHRIPAVAVCLRIRLQRRPGEACQGGRKVAFMEEGRLNLTMDCERIAGPPAKTHNTGMRSLATPCLAVLLIAAPCCASALGSLQLKLEERTTLHVGQIATLRLPSARPCDVESAGDALVPIKPAHPAGATVQKTRSETMRITPSAGAVVLVYRAARPGDETILIVPPSPPNGCVDCVTRHYFVTVLP